MKIAPHQKKQIDTLRATLKDLDGTVDRSARPAFRALSQKLDEWAARVAVIGQVKAGKSTFLNAFIRQHDFLPSDINPWTSVVTNLRINMPQDPATGASFEFFSEADWDEMIEGTDRIRKLAEELLPGFDTELLRKQSEEMRDRAQRRLGNHYKTLLGSSHDYDFLSPDLLKRYVCAGPGSDDGLTRDSLGRYAALTKVANVYLRMPEFEVPTIITDTPGVNDPFLVRDEFTCRSLDKSDVFIVVLSAHQALTDVDIALIRILAKQDNKDVLVFVNRIDELDDYCRQVPRVISDVSKRLADAIPDIEFSILAGSAYLADLALRTDEEALALRAEYDTDALAEFLIENYDDLPDDPIDRLLLASGLGRVKETLSMVIDNGIGFQQVKQLQEDTRTELNGAKFATKRERESVLESIDGVEDRAKNATARLEAEIAQVEGVRDRIDARISFAFDDIEEAVAESGGTLEKKLHRAIESFIEDQTATLKQRLTGRSADGALSEEHEIDLTPVQVEMEQVVFQTYQASRGRIDGSLADCVIDCREALKELSSDDIDVSLGDLPHNAFTSTLTLSKKSLNIDLIAEKSWAFWRKKKVDVAKSLNALKALTAAELRPSLEKVLAAFNEAQTERATAGCNRIQVIQRAVEAQVTGASRRLKREKTTLDNISNDPEAINRIRNGLQSQLEVLDRRLQSLAIVESKLSASNLDEAA